MNRTRSSAPSAGRMRTVGSPLLPHVAVINHFVIRGGSRAWFRHLVSPLPGFALIGYVLYEMDGAAKIMGPCGLPRVSCIWPC